jgi:excisionase family DNA binding protein
MRTLHWCPSVGCCKAAPCLFPQSPTTRSAIHSDASTQNMSRCLVETSKLFGCRRACRGIHDCADGTSNSIGENMTSQTASRHMTITEICSELGIARSTFYDWRASKKAPRCIKLPNGSIRIRRADFERWLTGHEDVA